MQVTKRKNARNRERGFTLLESMIATLIFFIGISGLMSLFVVATVRNSGQGLQASRTTEYAQDKMEQLMALSYEDTTSDTRGVQTVKTGGSGLGNTTPLNTYFPAGTLTAGTCLDALYCDYIVENGNSTTVSQTSVTNATYIRQWQIYLDNNGLKTITVIVTPLKTLGKLGPQTKLISQKTDEL